MYYERKISLEEGLATILSIKLFIVQEVKGIKIFLQETINREKNNEFELWHVKDRAEEWITLHNVDTYLNWLDRYIAENHCKRKEEEDD